MTKNIGLVPSRAKSVDGNRPKTGLWRVDLLFAIVLVGLAVAFARKFHGL